MSFAKWWLALVLCFSASPGESGETDATLSIEPVAEMLPANFLKFYLHFSEPMERGDVFRYLRLVTLKNDGTEEEVVEPFREVELWSGDFQTLTLWLHPGRQKPGVNLNVDLGPVLEEGRGYRLVVSPEWKTQSGKRLNGGLSKSFQAGPVDKQQPDPLSWRVARSSSRQLVVTTDGSLDPASLRKRLRVTSEPGRKALPVTIEAPRDRIRLSIETASDVKSGVVFDSWSAGDYRIIVDSQLEDLAGNSIARPFNLDLEEHPDFIDQTEPVTIPFTINGNLDVILTKP